MQIADQRASELVKRIVEAVHPLRIVLFGSTARGDAGRYSDIDVLVVMPEGTHRRETARTIYRNLLGSGLPVDVVVATSADLEKYGDSPALVYREALREGRELYAA